MYIFYCCQKWTSDNSTKRVSWFLFTASSERGQYESERNVEESWTIWVFNNRCKASFPGYSFCKGCFQLAFFINCYYLKPTVFFHLDEWLSIWNNSFTKSAKQHENPAWDLDACSEKWFNFQNSNTSKISTLFALSVSVVAMVSCSSKLK